jgi:hypothetical protein
MKPSKQQVLAEEILTAAIDAALKARAQAETDPFQNGKLMAYYDIITMAKELAGVMGVEFVDKDLAAFDPDELLKPAKQAA